MREKNDMKKIYENPKLQLLAVETADVITTSAGAFNVSTNPHSMADLSLDFTITW